MRAYREMVIYGTHEAVWTWLCSSVKPRQTSKKCSIASIKCLDAGNSEVVLDFPIDETAAFEALKKSANNAGLIIDYLEAGG